VSESSAVVCGGCGTLVDPAEPYTFRCPKAGDGGDHVLRRVLDPSFVQHAREAGAGAGVMGDAAETNPFLRFRHLLRPYHLASGAGVGDEWFVSLVSELDSAVAAVDGHGFEVTPFAEEGALAGEVGACGRLYVKDETRGVSGSHKARHLFGLLLHLEVVSRLGLARTPEPAELAIASCGNAALAAAVVAAAGRRRLNVFVPTDADPSVVERLRSLGASIEVCERAAGSTGDPTYLRLREAIAGGAMPFTCQGNENGLAIEGGITLAYEMACGLASSGAAIDHLVVQVGGGALASAVAQGFAEAVALGVLPRAPRFHTVQTESAWPLARAFAKVEELLPPDPAPGEVKHVLLRAAQRRAEFMWPWESAPHSIAHGILDDETYDWLAVVEAMLTTGGRAVVVGEEELSEANRLATAATGIDVDETGSAGLAGLVRLVRDGTIAADESAAVLFTGVRRRQASRA
jgi:threonine synthase